MESRYNQHLKERKLNLAWTISNQIWNILLAKNWDTTENFMVLHQKVYKKISIDQVNEVLLSPLPEQKMDFIIGSEKSQENWMGFHSEIAISARGKKEFFNIE